MSQPSIGPVIMVGGEPHAVLASYPRHFAMTLHSLVNAAVYRCDPCQQLIESTMVATSAPSRATCPACFARLTRKTPDNPAP